MEVVSVVVKVVPEVVKTAYVPGKKWTNKGQLTYVLQMYNGQNEYVTYKKRTKRSLNEHTMRMRYSSKELCYLSCSWSFTIQVELTSTDTYRIPRGC